MAILHLKEYFHEEWEDSYNIREAMMLEGIVDENEQDVILENAGRPFYEVSVDFTLDTDTGVVHVTHFQGEPLVMPKRM